MAREDRLSILERYGMTETTILTSNPYDGERRAGTVGFALPGVDVRICDMDSGEPVSSGEIGVLEVKGPNVFRGYWRMPEKTAQEFRPDGFFITGDLGRVDAGGYIQLVGRLKELVISGGFNVYPKEIENEIDALDGVLESAVFGAPHPDFGEESRRSSFRALAHASQKQVCSRRSASGSPNSRRRSESSSSIRCRATRWAKSRRRSCARRTRESMLFRLLPAKYRRSPRGR